MEVKWQGVYPAVTTKFTNDDKLDFDMFAKNNPQSMEELKTIMDKIDGFQVELNEEVNVDFK